MSRACKTRNTLLFYCQSSSTFIVLDLKDFDTPVSYARPLRCLCSVCTHFVFCVYSLCVQCVLTLCLFRQIFLRQALAVIIANFLSRVLISMWTPVVFGTPTQGKFSAIFSPLLSRTEVFNPRSNMRNYAARGRFLEKHDF